MTLVELLVVITILAILFVITLPAVSSAIEAGRRNFCQANQTKLALGMARYNSAKTFMPSFRNVMTMRHQVNPEPGQVSWLIASLPYLDQHDIYNKLESGEIWIANSNGGEGVGANIDFASFKCPSVARILGYRQHVANYLANAGASSASYTQRPDRAVDGLDPRDYRPSGRRGLADIMTGFSKFDGALGSNADGIMLLMQEIASADGTSTTLLLSETSQWIRWIPETAATVGVPPPLGLNELRIGVIRYVPLAPMIPSHIYGGGGFQPTPGGMNQGFVFNFPTSGTPTSTTQILNSGSGQVPSSNHPGGAVTTFVDGSTRFLSNGLPPYIYAHLVTSRSSSYSASTGYATNSSRANLYLLAAPTGTPAPYPLQPTDY